MFILKKGYQPGVYVPVRALFLVFLYNYTFYSHYNTVWIANTEIGLDPNNSVIKRLWCILNGFQLREQTRFYDKVQKEIIPKE